MVTNDERVEKYNEYGRTMALPTSYSRLRSICREASQPVRQTEEFVGSTFLQMGLVSSAACPFGLISLKLSDSRHLSRTDRTLVAKAAYVNGFPIKFVSASRTP